MTGQLRVGRHNSCSGAQWAEVALREAPPKSMNAEESAPYHCYSGEVQGRALSSEQKREEQRISDRRGCSGLGCSLVVRQAKTTHWELICCCRDFVEFSWINRAKTGRKKGWKRQLRTAMATGEPCVCRAQDFKRRGSVCPVLCNLWHRAVLRQEEHNCSSGDTQLAPLCQVVCPLTALQGSTHRGTLQLPPRL